MNAPHPKQQPDPSQQGRGAARKPESIRTFIAEPRSPVSKDEVGHKGRRPATDAQRFHALERIPARNCERPAANSLEPGKVV